MTPNRAAWRAQSVDPRVADSPFVSLRYHVDAWAADCAESLSVLRDELEHVRAEQAAALQLLRDNEAMRRHVLHALRHYPRREVVRCFHDGLALTAEIGRLEERAVLLRRQLERAESARDLMRRLTVALREAAAHVQLDERTGRLARASRQLLHVSQEAHEETAHAVLDGPMQRLSEAVLEAELASRSLQGDAAGAARHAAACVAAVHKAMDELELQMARLRPVSPDRPLVYALRRLLAASPLHDTARVRVMGIERRLPMYQELTLYRIAEEAVANAVRHSHSSQIEVVLSFHQDRVVLLVKDDGEGFDVVATEARLGRTRGLGLIEMNERAALLGTRLELRSLVGSGTEVRVMLAQRR